MHTTNGLKDRLLFNVPEQKSINFTAVYWMLLCNINSQVYNIFLCVFPCVCVCVNTQVNNVLQLRTLGAKNQQQQPIITTISFHLCTPKSLLPFHYITLATHHSALGRIK